MKSERFMLVGIFVFLIAIIVLKFIADAKTDFSKKDLQNNTITLTYKNKSSDKKHCYAINMSGPHSLLKNSKVLKDGNKTVLAIDSNGTPRFFRKKLNTNKDIIIVKSDKYLFANPKDKIYIEDNKTKLFADIKKEANFR